MDKRLFHRKPHATYLFLNGSSYENKLCCETQIQKYMKSENFSFKTFLVNLKYLDSSKRLRLGNKTIDFFSLYELMKVSYYFIYRAFYSILKQ